MYKDKEKRKQVSKESMRKKREGLTRGVNIHPLIYALADPVKREKLKAICASLKAHHVSELVSYGCRQPVSFDKVSEYCDCLV